MPSGPDLMAGVLLAGRRIDQKQNFSQSGLEGALLRVGFEFGSTFNSELSAQFSNATSPISWSSGDGSIGVVTLALGYTLTIDFFGKDGFTPYVGAGAFGGLANIQATPGSVVGTGIKPYIEVHGVAGLRYTFSNGLGFKAEIVYAYSYYNGLFAWQGIVGVAYRFGDKAPPDKPPTDDNAG